MRGAMEAAELPSSYFELYKLAVEMADRISARRGIANSFFLTANTGIVALLGSRDVRWYLAAAGIVFAAAWWALLKSYRDLNSAKFEIILAMEERLPISVYGDEWIASAGSRSSSACAGTP
ncbi:MAG: RipA family octameric membrane protein [Thermoleophilaceae bacterium]